MEKGVTTTLIGVGSVIVGLVAVISEEYRFLVITLGISLVTLFFLSSYIKQIENNLKEIKKLKEKLIIYERLSNIEARVSHLENEK